MFPVWQSVKVQAAEHARFGLAGIVQATNPEKPEEVAVRFDADLVVEVVAVADLVPLQ